MNRRRLPVLAALLAAALPLAPAFAADPVPTEKEEEGTEAEKAREANLADRIKPVSGHLFLKDGRFEISPGAGLSLADAFFQKYAFGLKATYHLAETFAVGGHVSYSLNTVGSAVTICHNDGLCERPKVEDLTDVPGKLGLVAGAEVAWSPLYGKVNLLAEKVLHFDTGVVAGADVIQFQRPGGVMGVTGGVHVGVGQRYFVTRSITIRVELRDYIYLAETVPLGDSTSKLENQLMLDLGVSFFLGGAPEER